MSDSSDHNRATIGDVAKLANVSIATVSRVINDTGQVAGETRTRVMQAIEQLRYTPQAAAKGLASRKTQTIGLIVHEISGPFFQPMLRGIEYSVRESGFDLLVNSTKSFGDSRRGFGPTLGNHNTDGLIVYTDSLSDDSIRHLRDIRFPVVMLYRTPPIGIDIPYVVIENQKGAFEITKLLIQCGRRRIAFLSGPEGNEDSHWRHIGYKEALFKHELVYDESLIGKGGFTEECAYKQTKKWLDVELDFDAVFAGADDAALGVLVALRERKLRIPEDVSVVGFDDIPLARHLTPPLTTVRAPIEEAGRETVRKLVQLITGQTVESKTVLPVEVIRRGSCRVT